jgi:hypothetical protein
VDSWRKVKAKLIVRYGTVKAAAASLGCHYNSIRYAQKGLCPGIKRKLDKVLE